jgi:hypothetical protein
MNGPAFFPEIWLETTRDYAGLKMKEWTIA